MNAVTIARIIAAIVPACPALSEPALRADPVSIRIPGTTVMLNLVPTPPGEITIGDEKVAIGPLWVARTEITWDLYNVFLYGLDKPDPDEADADGVTRPSKPYVPPDRGFGVSGYPAIGMTRHAAERFCVWLSETTGNRYRLPTKAEWIYLAEAGPDAENPGDSIWHFDNSDFEPSPVGRKSPNTFGLYDMLGNVAEWVATETNPAVAMGGSYLDELDRCTPRSRLHQTPAWNASDPQIPKSEWWLADCGFVGFRVVREPPENNRGNGQRE